MESKAQMSLNLYIEPIKKKQEKRNYIKSPLRYPGGKSRAVPKILELLPKGIGRLCSPFVGGASIELACASMLGINVYAYDAFEPLVNFWQVLLQDNEELVKVINKHYPLTKSRFYSLQKKYFDIEDRIEMAAVFFVLNRASFSGTTLSGGMSPDHPRFTQSAIEQLREFNIKNFKVEKADFRESMTKHIDDFLYLDPPYFIEQKLYGNKGDMHNGFEHETLAKMLKERKGWILSYNDCKEIREWYKGHHILTPEWAYGMNNSKQPNEVVILSKDFMAV